MLREAVDKSKHICLCIRLQIKSCACSHKYVHVLIDRTTKTKAQGWDDLKEDSIGGEESIRVAVRVRPFNAREAARGCKCCVEMSGQKTTLLGLSDRNGDGRKYCFFFRVVRCICGLHSSAHDVFVYGMLCLCTLRYIFCTAHFVLSF